MAMRTPRPIRTMAKIEFRVSFFRFSLYGLERRPFFRAIDIISITQAKLDLDDDGDDHGSTLGVLESELFQLPFDLLPYEAPVGGNAFDIFETGKDVLSGILNKILGFLLIDESSRNYFNFPGNL